MTVGELIEQLKGWGKDMTVFVWKPEDSAGMSDIGPLEHIALYEFDNGILLETGSGEHEQI